MAVTRGDKFTQTHYLYTAVAAPGFWFGGEKHRTKFHTLIPLKSCTAMEFGETFRKNVIIKDFCKILKNLFKKLHKNLKILQKIFKIKI